MKLKRLIIFVSILALIVSVALPFSAYADTTSTTYSASIVYSDYANSGTRDVICTSTEGTGISDYYTGQYSIDTLANMTSNELFNALRTFMTSTHKSLSSYANCRDYANRTDCQNGDTNTIVTIYTSYVTSHSEYNSGSGWNREHVWPKSIGGFETSGGGADLHHIRPAENRTNTQRSNRKYGNISSGTATSGNLSGLSGGVYSGNYFEPHDNVKGDVARICLYVYVRWGGTYEKSNDITNVFESIDVLLEWCALDPVDTWEMGRNEVVESIQGNRNVFIDYPELAWLIFDREIPSDMTTPSGWAKTGSADGVCNHINTALVNQKTPSCTAGGYTGDVRCSSCNALITSGQSLPMVSHSYDNGVVTKNPSHLDTGILTYTCSDCGSTINETLDKNSDHAYENWTSNSDNKTHTGVCSCGETKTEDHTIDNGVITKEATHLEDGVITYSCYSCEYSYEETIPKITEHTFSEWTPTNDGVNHSQACECGKIQSSAHQFDNGVVNKQPTHVEYGTKIFTCSDCGYTYTENIEKFPDHNFFDWFADANGTTHTRECECGEKETVEHTFSDGSVTREPTHTVFGEKTYSCTVCGYKKTENIDKLPEHTFGEWIADNLETHMDHYRVCECGKIERAFHNYDSGTVTQKPTHTAVGNLTYTCIDCGNNMFGDIDKLPEHTFGDWESDESGENHVRTCPCGETETESHQFNYGIVTVEPTAKSEGVKIYTCKICGGKKTQSIAKKGGCASSSGAMAFLIPFICTPAGAFFRKKRF